MKKSILLLFVFTMMLSAVQVYAQAPAKAATATVEVIQFHSEHRCYTCNKIERLTKETLSKNFSYIPFSLVNVDDKKNEKKAEAFQATGTALYLYNAATGKKKDLTNFAFMNAGNEKKFDAELQKQILEFIKG